MPSIVELKDKQTGEVQYPVSVPQAIVFADGDSVGDICLEASENFVFGDTLNLSPKSYVRDGVLYLACRSSHYDEASKTLTINF